MTSSAGKATLQWPQFVALNSNYEMQRNSKKRDGESVEEFINGFNVQIRGTTIEASILSISEENVQEGQVESKFSVFRKLFEKLGLPSSSATSDSSFPSRWEIVHAIQTMEFPPIFIQRKLEAKKIGNGEERVDVDTYRAILKDANLILSRLQNVMFEGTEKYQREADTIINSLVQRLDALLLEAKSHKKVYERIDMLAEQWFGKLALYAKPNQKENVIVYKEVVKGWLYIQEKKIANLAYELLAAHLKQEDASNDVLTQVNTRAVDLERRWEEIQPLVNSIDKLVIDLGKEQKDLSLEFFWTLRWNFTVLTIKKIAQKVKDLEIGKTFSPYLESPRDSISRDSVYSRYSVSSLGSTFSSVPRGMFPDDGSIFFLDLVSNPYWIEKTTSIPKLSFSEDSALVRVYILKKMIAFKAQINREIDEFCKEESQEWFSAAKELGVELSPTIQPDQKVFAKYKLEPALEKAFFDAINSAFDKQMDSLVEEIRKDIELWFKTKEGEWKGEEDVRSKFIEFVCTERRTSLLSFINCRNDDELRSAIDARSIFDDYLSKVFYVFRGRQICDKGLIDQLMDVYSTIRAGELSAQRPRRKTTGREMIGPVAAFQEKTD